MNFPQARFAIYFTPRRWSALGRFGRAWLGRDAVTGEAVERLVLPGFAAAELAALTAEPARYGWHATLKAPFRLARGTTLGELVAYTMGFAAARLPFEIQGMELASLGGFLALVPSSTPPLLAGLAEDCVRAFDGFRARPDKAVPSRRGLPPLSPRQQALSARWGYPYVMEEFRFHMTLTVPLAAEERARLKRALEPRLARLLARPVAVDAVSIFVEPGPGEPFRELRRFPFEAAG
ncbi:MAG: DUF1045 domain-containing protein [Alphaproteobacteria bacterium]